ncbi:hypothetical protein HYT23_02610 [Candidatus Pacearchaeota archaeon]|nr:hypothetical protein [Candidatus Pacearchaeota archaeon]
MVGLMDRVGLVNGMGHGDVVQEKPISAAYLQITPRKGLLKDRFADGKLEKFFDDFKGLFEFDEFEKDMRVFIENEESLIEQGHFGKYALFYHGKLWGILPVFKPLIDSFHKKEGNHSCYCDRIGEGFDPNKEF